MRRVVTQKGQVKRITGSFAKWYAKNNQATGTISATTEDDSRVSLALTQTTTEFVLLITGLKEGRALIKVTADSATSDATDYQLITVDVRDEYAHQNDYGWCA